jgi:hypothetical protein
MSISDVELEDLVEGDVDIATVEDEQIRQAVEGHRAMRRRLGTAFHSTRPGLALFVRIQSAVTAAGVKPAAESPREQTLTLPRWGIAVSAAAMVLVVLAAAILFRPDNSRPVTAGSSPGKVAQAVLAHIHTETSSHPAHPSDDWSDVRGYLAETTGIAPRLISGSRLQLVGGARTEFLGESAASYVLQTSRGPVTIVVMHAHPSRLNFDRCRQVDTGRVWACGFRQSRMVAIRVGDLTYCAIGKFDHDRLSDLLLPLLQTTTARSRR